MNSRFCILYIFIFLSLISLVFRTFFLQVIISDLLIREGDKRSLQIQSLFNIRGNINDRKGAPIAVTMTAHAIGVDPIVFNKKKNIESSLRWKALSEIISIPLKKIIFLIRNQEALKFIYLARQCSPEIGTYVKQLGLPGIIVLEESKRYYPMGEISTQLIGITNIYGKGIDGIEKSFNKILTGIPGERKIRINSKGQIIENISLLHQYQSNTLTLSINKKLQTIVYHQLKIAVNNHHADSGTAILLDINTGEILAMASNPSYNPNQILYSLPKNIRTQFIADIFQIGSLIKPTMIMQELKEDIITKKTIIQKTPCFIKKHQIHDITYYKQLTISRILKKSKDIGVSKIAISMPVTKLNMTYNEFGLEKITKTRLFDERNSLIFDQIMQSNLEKAIFSFGYGLMITPLQLVRLYATIGNYGIYHPLSILKINIRNPGIRIFPKQITKNILHVMERFTHKKNSIICSTVKNYRIATRAGIVNKINLKKKYINNYFSYTAGVAPVHNPKFSLIVIINNYKNRKYYGGAVTTSVFNAIMKLALKKMHIKPDNTI